MIVYIHICPNGKRYVGITQKEDPKERWDSGWGYQSNVHFFNAIKKYGWNNIEHQVFKVDTKEEMFYLEKYLISYYNTTNPIYGYNHSSGGEISNFGCHWFHTDESKKKISDSKKGDKNPMYGKHSWNYGRHTPYYGGGLKKGTKLKKHTWKTPDGNIVIMGAGQVHRFHPDWILIK